MSIPTPVAWIYLIRNNANGWVYIGVTKTSIETRFRAHLAESKIAPPGVYNPDTPLKKDIRKYGAESFTVELIENVYEKDLIGEVEGYWIDKYYGKNCYNLSPKSSYRYDRKRYKSVKRRFIEGEI